MSQTRQHASSARRLAAIMFTDIVGYTVLMGKDEEAAIKLLEKNRQLHKSTIQEFNGKWLKEMGDGILASFNAASDAVLCAKKIQDTCQKETDVSLRIGIHLGEVLFENADVFGDGVNIASRIESIAPAGSIYISESVLRNVENKKEIDTKYIGEKILKNVKHPVRVYQVKIEGQSNLKALDDPIAISTQDSEKSIAILPFVNMSNDPEQEYFCDGLSEELLNVLSQLDKFKVASRTSSFMFKGKNLDIGEIGQKLNVETVLEGSVRKSQNRIRITAQLINVRDGFHLWSERYDREMTDIFDIQDEIALSILNALKVKLLGEEKVDILKRSTDNQEAYQLYLKGRLNFHKFNPEGFKAAISYYEKAIEIEPDYARAHAGIGACYLMLWHFGFLPPDESLSKMQSATYKSIELDPQMAESHLALARLKLFYEFNLKEAEKEFQIAFKHNPNIPDALGHYSYLLAFIGMETEAMAVVAKAAQLDPFSPLIIVNCWTTSWLCRDYEGMLEQSKHLVDLHPNNWIGQVCTGLYHWSQSEYDQAIEAFKLSLDQNYSATTLSSLGCVYGIVGQKEKAYKILSKLNQIAKEAPAASFCFAKVYAGLDEMDEALKYLEKAGEERSDHLIFLDYYRRDLISVFNDPRVLDYMERVGVPRGQDRTLDKMNLP